MADWTFATSRQDHLDEHNQFDHTDLASLTEGRVLGVSGGKIAQIEARTLSVATFIDSGDSPYTVQDTDSIIMADSTSGSVTCVLPLTSTVDGQALLVKRIVGGNAVSVGRSGSDVINTDGGSDTSKSLDDVGAHWSGVASDLHDSWYTIGEHGTVS